MEEKVYLKLTERQRVKKMGRLKTSLWKILKAGAFPATINKYRYLKQQQKSSYFAYITLIRIFFNTWPIKDWILSFYLFAEKQH